MIWSVDVNCHSEAESCCANFVVTGDTDGCHNDNLRTPEPTHPSP